MSKMDNFIDEMLSKLSSETIKILSTLDIPSEAERASMQVEEICQDISDIKLETYHDELKARLQLEEREVKMYKQLNEELNEQLEIVSTMDRNLESPDKQKIQKQIESYREMMKKSSPSNKFDVCALVDMHKEVAEKREKVNAIEKKLSHFAGLPPNVTEAKQALRTLEEEVKMLERNAHRDLAEDVAKYLNK